MATTSEGQAKLDRMVASGMGKQQALKMLIDAQKKQNAAASSSSSSSVVPRDTSRDVGPLNPISQPGSIQFNPGFGIQPDNGLPRVIIDATPASPSSGGSISTSMPAVEQPKIKAATPDLLQSGTQDVLPLELQERLILENIGGQELLLTTRHDLINGQNITYQPIVNLPDISLKYGPNKIISLSESAEQNFGQFSIRLEEHIPGSTALNGEPIVYMSSSGDIVVNTDSMNDDYAVEIEIISSGQIFNDTIY